MKKVIFDNPNKMHFESDYALFNKQTDYIGHGNVFSTTQTSFCVRPYNEVKNGYYTGKPGDFLRYDLGMFDNIPYSIRAILEDRNREKTYFLHDFHVWKNGQKETIGWVVTDTENNLIKYLVVSGYRKNYWKRESAIRECIKYICN